MGLASGNRLLPLTRHARIKSGRRLVIPDSRRSSLSMLRIAFAAGVASALLFPGTAHASEPNEPSRAEVKAAVEKALPLLWKGVEGHVARKSCFACHNQVLPMLALAAAEKRGFAIMEVDLK